MLVNESDRKPQDDDLRAETTVSSDNLGSLAIARIKFIRHLFNKRSFWKRAWILQELVLAKQVLFLCGAEGFQYNDIRDLSYWLDSTPDASYHSSLSESDWINFKTYLDLALSEPLKAWVLAVQLRKHSFDEEPQAQFWQALMYARRMIASDPRDKIYSLLSLVQVGVSADYSKTVQALYLEVAQILFPQVAMHKWFNKATPSYKRIPALPSWVVDWDSRSKKHDLGVSLDGYLYNAAATMGSPGRQVEIDGSSLLVRGAVFDKISLLATPCSSDYIGVNATNAFQFDITGGQPNGDIECDLVPPNYPRGQASLRLSHSDVELGSSRRFAINSTYLSLALDFVKVVTACAAVDTAAGRLESGQIHEENRSHFIKLFFDEDAADKTLDSDFLEAMEKEHEVPKPRPFSQHSQVIRFSRHFMDARHFYTQKRYLGYGPNWIQEGDIVCVLQDCRVPVLLRKVDNYYIFISTCFVLGIMDGEVGQMVNKGEISMQTFDIR